jgi:hypothetical protein
VSRAILIPPSMIEVSTLKPYQNKMMNWKRTQLSTYLNTTQKYLTLKWELDKIEKLGADENYGLLEYYDHKR